MIFQVKKIIDFVHDLFSNILKEQWKSKSLLNLNWRQVEKVDYRRVNW